EVRTGVRKRQTVEDTTSGPVPLRRHRTLEAGKEDETLGPGRDRGRVAAQQIVRIALPASLGLPLGAGELVAPPAKAPARYEAGVLQQPHVGVGVGMALDEHRLVSTRFRRG